MMFLFFLLPFIIAALISTTFCSLQYTPSSAQTEAMALSSIPTDIWSIVFLDLHLHDYYSLLRTSSHFGKSLDIKQVSGVVAYALLCKKYDPEVLMVVLRVDSSRLSSLLTSAQRSYCAAVVSAHVSFQRQGAARRPCKGLPSRLASLELDAFRRVLFDDYISTNTPVCSVKVTTYCPTAFTIYAMLTPRARKRMDMLMQVMIELEQWDECDKMRFYLHVPRIMISREVQIK